MQKLFSILLLIFLLAACSNNDENGVSPSTLGGTPIIKSASTYPIRIERNITYGEGLSHQSLNSTSATVTPLQLDVHIPENDSENRPAYLFIHGGGFTGGDKRQEVIENLADYYSSRGWVFISINYRLLRDIGTVPQEWVDYSASLPADLRTQFLAIYPAQRDAKAAVRWLVANADTYNINTDYITVGGGSAGAITAITVGISNPEDFRDEIDSTLDNTLASTNINQSFQVKTIIDHWGSDVALEGLEAVYGHNRFNSNNPPLFIAHGTEDPTVLYSEALELKEIYENNGVPLAFYPLEGAGHGVWNFTVDGKRLEELAFEFIVEQQTLVVED